MSGRPVRNFTRLAVAIVVAAIVISAAVLSYSSFQATVTKTVVAGTETISTSTVITTVTQTGASQLYQVEFLQESNCFYGSWLLPWAVMLDGQTIVQPSNAPHFIQWDPPHRRQHLFDDFVLSSGWNVQLHHTPE